MTVFVLIQKYIYNTNFNYNCNPWSTEKENLTKLQLSHYINKVRIPLLFNKNNNECLKYTFFCEINEVLHDFIKFCDDAYCVTKSSAAEQCPRSR